MEQELVEAGGPWLVEAEIEVALGDCSLIVALGAAGQHRVWQQQQV